MIFIISLTDPCLTLHCNHICINTRAGPTCVCSDGFELNHDGKSCTGNALIYVNSVTIMCRNYNVKYKNSTFLYSLVFK